MWSNDGGETWSAPIEIMSLGAGFGGQNQLTKDSAGVLHAVLGTGGGVYSASWTGTQWGPPEQIDARPIDPHGQTITTCQGNQLHVAYYDRTGEERVWYSTRSVSGPHIDRKPMPTPEPLTIKNPANSGPQIGATVTPIGPAQSLNDIAINTTAPASNPVNPVVGAIVPVSVMIVVIVALRRRR
jgi:hypothetical protein